MFYQGFSGLVRVILVGSLAYFAMIFLLRISGKRTLSKMNAFDMIVTVALGSTLATVLLSKDVALLEGIAAFALLIFLQYVITWLSVRSGPVSRMIKAEPALLVYKGSYLKDRMQSERVLPDEILAAVRNEGAASLESILAVVLETDGTFTVIPDSGSNQTTTALENVRKP